MSYDATLKELFQGAPQRLLELLTGSRPAELLTVEYSSTRICRPDLVVRLADGRLFHLELQGRPDPDMPWRMLEYFSLLTRQFQQPPEQLMLYTGAGSLPIPAALDYQPFSSGTAWWISASWMRHPCWKATLRLTTSWPSCAGWTIRAPPSAKSSPVSTNCRPNRPVTPWPGS